MPSDKEGKLQNSCNFVRVGNWFNQHWAGAPWRANCTNTLWEISSENQRDRSTTEEDCILDRSLQMDRC